MLIRKSPVICSECCAAADRLLTTGWQQAALSGTATEVPMIKTALDNFEGRPVPSCSAGICWTPGPAEGWIRLGFEGKPEFCNPAGFIQGGMLSAMLDDTMGPAVFAMTQGRLYTTTISMTVNFLAPAKPGPDHRRGEGDPARQDHRLRRGEAEAKTARCWRPRVPASGCWKRRGW